ncbi:MAG: dolichyl-phosphate beta-glucosyltransferase [Rubrobacteraceae bacterium]
MIHHCTRQGEALPYQQVSVEVVVPVYNEQDSLPDSIPALCEYLANYFPYYWSVVIADNASTDATLAVSEGLARSYRPYVTVLHLEEKGRGRALKAAWLASNADVVAYMDVDLSTNLWSLLPLVAPLTTGHSDVAIGSRLLKGASVTRQWKREFISRCYNLLIKTLFANQFSDAQCGFKAVKGSIAQELIPLTQDNEWFFDTELLLVAEEQGLRISEVPVDWIEDLDSRVDIASTAMKDVRGLLRIRTRHLKSKVASALGGEKNPKRAADLRDTAAPEHEGVRNTYDGENEPILHRASNSWKGEDS